MASPFQGASTALLLSLLLLSFSPAQAAPDPVIRLTPPQASSFAPAFTALAAQAHVTVVAEDQPLHTALTPPAAAALKLDKDGEPLSTLLPKLAAAYDYDVQPSGKVFLLKKRYTDAADLPSVTVKECVLGLDEVNRDAGNFDPHIPLGAVDKSRAISDLIYSLTPEQLETMKESKGGLPVASLAPVQQQEIQQFVMHLYVQREIMELPAMLAVLNRVSATDTKFGWRYFPKMNAQMFGYDAPHGDGYMAFLMLSKPDQVKVHLGVGMEIAPAIIEGEAPATPATAMQPSSGPDPTDPVPTPAKASKPPPVSSSLGDILTRLNTRAADGLKVTIEPYLAPKQVTIFGEEAAAPRQEVAALADVYGLRVFTEDKHQGHDRLRLTRLTAPVPQDLFGLHAAILQALPGPLVRACRMHPLLGDPASAQPGLLGVRALRVYAVRQIRAAVEPRLRTSRGGRVALSTLSEQEGRAFAVTLMLDAMDALASWTAADLPDTIARFNELRLGGGLYEADGKKQMSLMVGFPNPSNPSNFIARSGVGEINYDPAKRAL